MTKWFDYEALSSNAYQTAYLGPGTDTPHFAYDLQTPFHTPLTAPLAGTVAKADYAAWGGEIFVQPDDKSYPEYYFYHPDVLEVKTGDHVSVGEEIALSGGENPGFPGAQHPASTHWSTGPHTHVGWFTKWVSTPGGTKPFGPDTASLIAIAKSNGNQTIGPGGSPLITPFSTPAPAGLGPIPGIGDITNWISANVGAFAMRVGVGLAGLALIYIGGSEIVHSLQDSSPVPAPAPAPPVKEKLETEKKALEESAYLRRGKRKAPPPPKEAA